MDIVLKDGNLLFWPGGMARAAIGRSGLQPEADKREGDGTTPIGTYPLRRVYYRPDKGPPPETRLSTTPISFQDGWCDAPEDPAYNRRVKLPYPASAEHLWRDDGIYDLIVEIGHNDSPVRPGFGSAVFIHIAHADYRPTEGCLALAENDLRSLLSVCGPGDLIRIG